MSLSFTATGIGLRQPHYQQILQDLPPLDFLEVHSENFFHAGGASLHVLERVRQEYPVSLHGVGLSLATIDPQMQASANNHLAKLQRLVEQIQPILVSEHLCWGATDGKYFNDLLPFPYTAEALNWLAQRIDYVQNVLKRPILIENLSAYLQFVDAEYDEFSFLAELAQRSGCRVLLDINNLYVNACNFNYDPWPLIQKLSARTIGEIHLAGHTRATDCLIDTHSDVVCAEVWDLYQRALAYFGPIATLIEWDTDIPPLATLLEQAELAQQKLNTAAEYNHTLPIASACAPNEFSLDTMNLKHVQSSFGAALLSSQNADQATSLFTQPHAIAMDRLAIYRGNVVNSITQALKAAYPVVEKIVGGEFFAALARAYWQKHPSESGDLYDYGSAFSEFIEYFPHTQNLPYLADVARMEWKVHQAYAAIDEVPLLINALAGIPVNELSRCQISWQKAASLQRSRYPIADIWLQHQTDYRDEISIDWNHYQNILIYRQNDKVKVTRLAPDAYLFFEQLQHGILLEVALLKLFEQFPESQVDALINLAFSCQLITSLKRNSHDPVDNAMCNTML